MPVEGTLDPLALAALTGIQGPPQPRGAAGPPARRRLMRVGHDPLKPIGR